jgi:hypothetical protein
MTRTQSNGTISTRSIDTAAYVMAATGQDCTLSFVSGSIATFVFQSDFATRDALVSFETGGEVEGKRLLEIRNQLFRRIKGGGR